MYVARDSRGQGIGRALLEALIQAQIEALFRPEETEN